CCRCWRDGQGRRCLLRGVRAGQVSATVRRGNRSSTARVSAVPRVAVIGSPSTIRLAWFSPPFGSKEKGKVGGAPSSLFFGLKPGGASRVDETPAVLERYRLIPLLLLSALQTRILGHWPSYGSSHCRRSAQR